MPSFSQQQASDLFRREPERHIETDGGATVAHRQVGSGPDLLFVHGWPVSGATFRCLLPHLVGRRTCHVIDLPGTGSSRFDESSTLSVDQHVRAVRRTVDELGLDDVALIGHDSGGLIARHAMGGDPRLRAMGLINTEPPDPSWRFTSFIAASRAPGFATALGWIAGRRRLRRNRLVLGDAFADRSLLDGEFDEFFLQPLHADADRLRAAIEIVRSFDMNLVRSLPDLHRAIEAPVRLVWGDQDPFFPVDRARAMVATFPEATLSVVEGAGLFSHEERPGDVARALLEVV